jgi:site-specific recombinase XerD
MRAAAARRKAPVKLSKPLIAKLKSGRGDKPEIFWDSDLRGFGVLVSGKTCQKSYVVQYGSIPRRTVGRCDLISLDQARGDAVQLLGKLVNGIDPKKERREAELAHNAAAKIATKLDLSLREVFESFAAARKDMSEVTVPGYRRLLENYVSDWLDRPLRSITGGDVERRHSSVAEDISRRRLTKFSTGHASANGVMRVIRIVWNYSLARELVPGLGQNPVSMLSKIRAWYADGQRDNPIVHEHLGPFFEGVSNDQNPIHRDLILLMLFTGLRFGESSSLRWRDIDFTQRLFRLDGTKTYSGKPLDLPMTSYVEALLRRRRAECPIGEFVFPGNGKSGHTENPRAALARACRQIQMELPYYSSHDLRHTFSTTAEACDISPYALKGLLNQSTGKDVTAGYVHLTTERLRDAADRILARLQSLIGPSFQSPDTIHNS